MISVSFPSIFFMRLSIVSCLTFLAVISRAAAEDVGQFRRLDRQQHRRRGDCGPECAGRDLSYQPVQPQPDRQALQGRLVRRTLQLLFLPALYVAWFRVKAPDRSAVLAHEVIADQLEAHPA